MPLYEYKCPNGHVFEVIHGMTQPSPETCEVCGASPLVRVLHPVAVHYKGSGFYSTDYGRGGKKPVKEGGGSGESSSSGSGDSGSGGSGSAGSGSSSGSGDSGSSSGSSSGESGSSSGGSKAADN
jgi:putative FmdB family regulatory protein